MVKIGLISDTHGYIDQAICDHFAGCDEIWHAGDFGNMGVVTALEACKPLRGVYGNIDGQDIRGSFPELLQWQCEDIKVMMLHIGGYPPKYNPATLKQIKAIKPQLFISGHSHNPKAKAALLEYRPQLFISGHSHILKVMFDNQLECLHMNPGAAGKQGWHKVRTLIRFVIDGKNIKDCEVIELRT